MKKQFLAKLLVLAMVLSMIPGTMLIAGAAAAGSDDGYYGLDKDAILAEIEKMEESSTASNGDEATAESIGVDDITVEDGSAKIKATVSNGVAKLKLDAKAVAGLADAVKSGVLTLEIDDEGATSLEIILPARAMTTLAKESGADLDIKSSVAEITIPNSVLSSALGKSGNVSIKAEHSDKSISFSIQLTGGKSLKNIKGVKVEF